MRKFFIEKTKEYYNECSNIGIFFVAVFLLLTIVIGLFCLEVVLGAWLWKIIAVSIFNLPILSFWQFLGLKILLTILIPYGTTELKKED